MEPSETLGARGLANPQVSLSLAGPRAAAENRGAVSTHSQQHCPGRRHSGAHSSGEAQGTWVQERTCPSSEGSGKTGQGPGQIHGSHTVSDTGEASPQTQPLSSSLAARHLLGRAGRPGTASPGQRWERPCQGGQQTPCLWVCATLQRLSGRSAGTGASPELVFIKKQIFWEYFFCLTWGETLESAF